MDFRTIESDDELPRLARLAAPLQADPTTCIGYLAIEPDAIAAELVETTWRDVSAVAVDGDRVVGWLIGDVEPSMGRVWWFGPYATGDDWEAVADGLLASCRSALPAGVDEEELAVDARFQRCRAWAPLHGFVEEEGSSVLVLDRPVDGPSVDVRAIEDDDHDVVVELHEELFPGTHTTGRDLVTGHDDTHRRLIVDVDGRPAGYVAVELQPDGHGYIDYLGVASEHRRMGLGAQLVRTGVAELGRLGASGIGLTVRESNHGARALYAALGFTEERILIPMRRGFSLA